MRTYFAETWRLSSGEYDGSVYLVSQSWSVIVIGSTLSDPRAGMTWTEENKARNLQHNYWTERTVQKSHTDPPSRWYAPLTIA